MACNADLEVDIGLPGVCIPKGDPAAFASTFYQIGLGLIGGVAVLFIIYGSYTILTSQGRPEMLNKGKSYIYYAIAGLLLAIFGYVFLEVVLVDILHVPGFK
jgi:Na+-driven multidrug efflux pump